jgi:2-hydroxychromene-2-carboxylate isomerase
VLTLNAQAVKGQLRANTDEAVALGICGAPTFQMGEGEKKILIWGGDRLNHVADLVLGWR